MITNLNLKAIGGFDLESRIGRDSSVAERFPFVDFQNDTEMEDWHVVTVDGIVVRLLLILRLLLPSLLIAIRIGKVSHDLVAK